MANFVTTEREGHIAFVTLDRPDALNAISGEVAEEVAAAFEAAGVDRDVWVVVLGAVGDKAFCVGADLKERAGFSLDDWYDNRKKIRGMFAALRRVPQPTIAAIFGFALGGGFELALSCDLIVAAEGTKVGLPEARVGLLPAGGGTQLLARAIGPARAKQMIFTGARVDVAEAHGWGLVAEVVPRDILDSRVRDVALGICASSPVAVREAKHAIGAGLGAPIENGIELEHESWERVVTSADRAEGITAFNEKRDPIWKNA